jgi:predicted esterase
LGEPARDAPRGGEKAVRAMRALQLPFGRLMFLGAFVLSAAAGRSADGGDALANVRAQLTEARTALIAGIDRAKQHTDDAYDIIARLDTALAALDENRAKSDPGYVADAALETSLDRSLVDQILSGKCADPKGVNGTGELCFASSRDRTLQPLAVVVPRTYRATPATPLIVFLRERGESEAGLASRHEVRELAEATGAIIAAPYARGRAEYNDAATQDVLDATRAIADAFAIDSHRVYIAGFSNGGMAAFHVVGSAPGHYTSLLSVAGALEVSDREAAAAGLRDRHAYVVAGARDDIVPVAHARDTAGFLRSRGVDVSYYEEPNGKHALRTLAPALKSAWHDMLAGASHGFLEPAGAPSPGIFAPAPSPGGSMRPS